MNRENKTSAIESFKTDPISKIIIKNSIPALIAMMMVMVYSMGGLTASGYADDHRDMVDGLILVAAYANRDISNAQLPVLAVFGDADGVMNKGLYEKRKAWNPADFEEHIIPGANHAQYGDYGKQPRDNDATISADEQQNKTAEIILDWLNRHFSEVKANEQ